MFLAPLQFTNILGFEFLLQSSLCTPTVYFCNYYFIIFSLRKVNKMCSK